MPRGPPSAQLEEWRELGETIKVRRDAALQEADDANDLDAAFDSADQVAHAYHAELPRFAEPLAPGAPALRRPARHGVEPRFRSGNANPRGQPRRDTANRFQKAPGRLQRQLRQVIIRHRALASWGVLEPGPARERKERLRNLPEMAHGTLRSWEPWC